ncbi:MAG: hypothetical protein ACLGI2_00865 [Acidimicrobiia bacterium]
MACEALRQLDGPADEAPEVEIPEESVHFVTPGYLRYAEAVAAGRSGDAVAAETLLRAGDCTLSNQASFRQLGRRIVAEAALVDGWGDPVQWLLEALEYFERQGDDPIASASRSLLRKAGATVAAGGTTRAFPASSGGSA